jgi:hypothetical protein
MATEPRAETVVCIVCREEAELRVTAECNWCDQRFHLNQRNDVEAQDCGDVWIDEQYLALQFACAGCLSGDAAGSRGAAPPRHAPPPAGPRAPAVRQRRYKRRA